MPDVSAVITGVGQTEYSRRSGRSEQRLAVEAALAAARDANIDPRHIDGIIAFPYAVSAEELVSALGLPGLRYSGVAALGGASSVAAVGQAALAVAGGRARNVLIVRARNGCSGGRINQRPSQLPAQHLRTELEHRYGWNTPAQRYAMICRRYMHTYGLARETLGEIAVVARRWANLNPAALMHGRELTLDQYLAGRMIADPYTLFDCCLETDGACAVIVSAAAGSRDGIRVLACTEGRPPSPDDLTNRPDLLAIGLEPAAAQAWELCGLGPSDMDAVMIYDCFTFEVLHQLEAAGFAPPGGAATLVHSGALAPGGRLPLNPHGGLLSEGHLSGLNHVVEAVRQLRGAAGARQVPNVRHIAVTGWGDLGDGTMAVLANQRGAQ
jgi:acetyl-CoA acetyltransferase